MRRKKDNTELIKGLLKQLSQAYAIIGIPSPLLLEATQSADTPVDKFILYSCTCQIEAGDRIQHYQINSKKVSKALDASLARWGCVRFESSDTPRVCDICEKNPMQIAA
jgi:hypothetical protein